MLFLSGAQVRVLASAIDERWAARQAGQEESGDYAPFGLLVEMAASHGLRVHDLWDSYASLLVERGAHPKEMAELMGHSSVQITLDRYSHVMPRLTAALADRMDNAYRDAAPDDRGAGDGNSVVVQFP